MTQTLSDQWLEASKIPLGSDAIVHKWVVSNQGQCDLIPGATWNAGSCESTFLNLAIEIVGDMVGNENFLCESNEDCLYTPYVGSYQGHGLLARVEQAPGVPYVFVDGTISGVTLYQHAQMFAP